MFIWLAVHMPDPDYLSDLTKITLSVLTWSPLKYVVEAFLRNTDYNRCFCYHILFTHVNLESFGNAILISNSLNPWISLHERFFLLNHNRCICFCYLFSLVNLDIFGYAIQILNSLNSWFSLDKRSKRFLAIAIVKSGNSSLFQPLLIEGRW